MKKVVNIVFYATSNERKAVAFYDDGTEEEISQEAGKEILKQILIEETDVKAGQFDNAKDYENAYNETFNRLLNNNRIYVMSEKDYLERKDSFVIKTEETIITPENLSLTSEEKLEEDIEEQPVLSAADLTQKNNSEETEEVSTDRTSSYKIEIPSFIAGYTNKFAEENIDYAEDDNDDPLLNESEEAFEEQPEEKQGLVTRIKNAISNRLKLNKKGAAFGLAALLAFSSATGYAVSKKNPGNVMLDSNIVLETEAAENGNDDVITTYASNEYTQETETLSAFETLLEESNCEQQVTVMQQMSSSLDMFNISFADAYVEEGKNIKAALSWDEMMAIQMAYNDGSRTYKPCEIRKIFNGTRVDDEEMTNAYKNASLQLMGAYIIEKEGNLVDLSELIYDEEGLAFAEKYQNLLETAKNTTGEEQIVAVKAFYNELYKDFPITEEVRTEGISHADTRNIKSYELAVAPMVAAAEMMFQNLSIDETLTDKAIDYFNDIGLCNEAQDTFEELETITLTNCDGPDETLPYYEEFKQAKINELTETDHYVINDYYRDLSQLDSFQERVNGNYWKMVNGQFVVTTTTEVWTKTTYNSYDVTTTRTWTETTTETRNEEVPESEYNWEVVDTTDNTDEMQDEADKHKEELEEEVEKDDKDLQDKIDDANDKIDNGEEVNEDDFGDHNVDFDDDHSDENGNLDDSVKDITTDGEGAKESTDLPDPNATGSEFDESYQESESKEDSSDDSSNSSDTSSDESQDSSSDEESDTKEDSSSDSKDLPDPEETGEKFDKECETKETTTTTTETTTTVEETYEEVTEKSDEEKVNEYVDSLVAESEDESAKVLTK